MSRTQALAVPARLSVLPVQVRAWVRRPEGFVEGTRWLLVMLVLASLLLALPAPLSVAHGTIWLVGVAWLMAEMTALRLHLARFTVPRETSPIAADSVLESTRPESRAEAGERGLKRRRRSDDWR